MEAGDEGCEVKMKLDIRKAWHFLKFSGESPQITDYNYNSSTPAEMNSIPSSLSSVRCLRPLCRHSQALRSFSTSLSRRDEALQTQTLQTPPPTVLDPNTAWSKEQEAELKKQGLQAIGSRRRRAAIASSQNIPFEQLPYQCFQEARKILRDDREEKVKQIESQRRRIELVSSKDAALMGGDHIKKGRLMAMERYLEDLKILADVNDPLIKKRFEDGQGK